MTSALLMFLYPRHLLLCICLPVRFEQVEAQNAARAQAVFAEELNALEREFLGVMEYRLFVGPDTFSDALMELELCLEVEAKSEGSFESERQVIFV